jgi:GH24 family phage-related lysozyme (muramidase)
MESAMAIPPSVITRTESPDFENNIPWMYLDTGGNVTVGAGHLIPDAGAAAGLNFVDAGGAAASADAKQQEWNTMHGQDPGHVASYYQQFTTLHLGQADIDSVLTADMELAQGYLRNAFPNYDSFPQKAQEGLLDMMFNMGPGKFTQQKWPSFFAAVNATPPDWTAAANQCHRAGISDTRNSVVRQLFLDAASGTKGPRR